MFDHTFLLNFIDHLLIKCLVGWFCSKPPPLGHIIHFLHDLDIGIVVDQLILGRSDSQVDNFVRLSVIISQLFQQLTPDKVQPDNWKIETLELFFLEPEIQLRKVFELTGQLLLDFLGLRFGNFLLDQVLLLFPLHLVQMARDYWPVHVHVVRFADVGRQLLGSFESSLGQSAFYCVLYHKRFSVLPFDVFEFQQKALFDLSLLPIVLVFV